MLKNRKEYAPPDAVETGPKLTRRMHRHLEKVREFDADYEIEHKTLEQLIAEEAEETGVNEMPGGDGLATPVKLKVFHRDSSQHSDCRESGLRFEVRSGADPENATEHDVRLVCNADHAAFQPPEPEPPRETSADLADEGAFDEI
jgi:hypothetical protein